MGVLMNKIELLRFQKKIELDILSGCWIWKASKDAGGYGKIVINHRLCAAHRVSYEYWNGQIPNGLEIDHLCRNRNCVNPQHLEVVTRQENLLRSNITIGFKNSNQKLCPRGHYYSSIIENNKKRRVCFICRNHSENRRFFIKEVVV